MLGLELFCNIHINKPSNFVHVKKTYVVVVGLAVVVHLGSLAVAGEHENCVVVWTGGKYVGFGVGALVGGGGVGRGGAVKGTSGFG